MSVVADNVKRVRELLSALRLKQEIAIVGVTKKQPIERIREAVEAGITLLGNNYVQDGEELRAALPEFKGSWHFIGHVQRRKAKLLTNYDCVQSLDRLEVARELSERAKQGGKPPQNVLVEVNIGAEVNKSGVLPKALLEFLDQASALEGIRLTGLMCLPPPLDPPTARTPYFEEMRQLYEMGAKRFPFQWLSMGTSDDYLVAVKSGANMIRLGTTIFGARP